MAGDAGEGTFGGADAGIAKIIRLIIASPVHLIRDDLAATLRGRADLIVVDVTDLSPRGIARIADTQPGTVLVDLGRTDPAAAARAIKAVCRRARFVAFAVDETDDHVFACATAGFCGYVAPESGAKERYRALVDVRWKAACTARRISRRQRLPASLDCSGSSTASATAGAVVTRDCRTRRAGLLQQGNRALIGDQHCRSQKPHARHSAEVAGKLPRPSGRPGAWAARGLSLTLFAI